MQTYTTEEFEEALRIGCRTSGGMLYTTRVAGKKMAGITLFKESHHTTQDTRAAKKDVLGKFRLAEISTLGPAAQAHAWPTKAFADRPIEPANFRGKVVYVDDGDTVIILTDDREQVKVRLSSIDAPESSHTDKRDGRVGQPYANSSKRYLEGLVKGKIVDAKCADIDRYGRSVCDLLVDGKSANEEMVRQGWAWANQAAGGRYMRDDEVPGLEAAARRAHVGLWAGARPVSPWEWREACWQQHDCPN